MPGRDQSRRASRARRGLEPRSMPFARHPLRCLASPDPAGHCPAGLAARSAASTRVATRARRGLEPRGMPSARPSLRCHAVPCPTARRRAGPGHATQCALLYPAEQAAQRPEPLGHPPSWRPLPCQTVQNRALPRQPRSAPPLLTKQASPSAASSRASSTATAPLHHSSGWSPCVAPPHLAKPGLTVSRLALPH